MSALQRPSPGGSADRALLGADSTARLALPSAAGSARSAQPPQLSVTSEGSAARPSGSAPSGFLDTSSVLSSCSAEMPWGRPRSSLQLASTWVSDAREHSSSGSSLRLFRDRSSLPSSTICGRQ